MNFTLPAFDAVPWFVQFTLAAVRPLACVVLLPPLAGAGLPWRGRLALVAACALFGGFRPGASTLAMAMIPNEILAGLLAGLGLALAFGAATLAGEMLAQMVGLGFANLGPMGGNAGALSGLMTTLAWVALLVGDLHLELFANLAAGIGQPVDNMGFGGIAVHGAMMFLWGLKVALPVLAVMLLAQAVVAMATRAAPQLSAMAVGPAALLVAFILLIPLVFDHLLGRLSQALATGLGLVG